MKNKYGNTVSERYFNTSTRETFMFNKLFDYLNESKNKEYIFTPTLNDIAFRYDGDLIIKENNEIIMNAALEAKVRETVYDTYILQNDKINRMWPLYRDDNKELLYVNFTTEYTVIWNIIDLDSEGVLDFDNSEFIYLNEYTVQKSEKVKKRIWYLSPDLGIVIPVKYNEKEYREYFKTIHNQ